MTGREIVIRSMPRREAANQLAHRGGGLGHRHVADDHPLAKDADDDGLIVFVQGAERLASPSRLRRTIGWVGAHS